VRRCSVAFTGLEYSQQYHADDATEIHARRAMRTDEIDESDYKFVASLEPVAVLYDDDGELKRRMTDRVPKPKKTVIRQADDTEEIKTGLKMPDDGVFFWATSLSAARRCGPRPLRPPSITG